MSQTPRICSCFGVITLIILLILTATPAAQAQSTTAFTGEYFNNMGLSGTPVLVRDDPTINFDWGNGSPGPSISADHFSVRWQRWYNVNPAGSYTFTVTSDDGSRLWVDGVLVVDMWWDHGPLTRPATISLTAGYHLIRMEYYDNTGGALAQLNISSVSSYPDWKGEYFDNQTLSGSPVLTVNNSQINFNWGSGSPDPSIPADHFSVRWTRTVHFTEGRYRFSATADDGIRMWVGSELLIDQWHDQSPTTYTRDMQIATADLGVTVEYYEDTAGALAQVNWIQVPTIESWFGQYYDNPSLSGAEVFNRNDLNLSFDWGAGSPGAGVPSDNFSAKWSSRRNSPTTGFYTVYATADDGVRVSVDNNILIDQWHDQAPTTYAATVYLGAGMHDWHVEYYEHFGGAMINVQIMAGVSPPTPPPSGDIIVDDRGAGWLAGGTSSSWRTAAGYGAGSFWTFNDAFVQPLYNWARWYPSLPQARNYEVFAYIPGGVGSTRNARYWIAHGGTYTLKPVAQALYPNQWVSLGTYYFSAAGGEYVSLSDVTYECYLCSTVAFDSLKFSAR